MSFTVVVFFFNDTATTEIYTLPLHDALPISVGEGVGERAVEGVDGLVEGQRRVELAAVGQQLGATADSGVLGAHQDRKSTRLNSSHANISYAVFCLKKKIRTHNVLNPVNTVA